VAPGQGRVLTGHLVEEKNGDGVGRVPGVAARYVELVEDSGRLSCNEHQDIEERN
jgi:hypothetical protein